MAALMKTIQETVYNPHFVPVPAKGLLQGLYPFGVRLYKINSGCPIHTVQRKNTLCGPGVHHDIPLFYPIGFLVIAMRRASVLLHHHRAVVADNPVLVPGSGKKHFSPLIGHIPHACGAVHLHRHRQILIFLHKIIANQIYPPSFINIIYNLRNLWIVLVRPVLVVPVLPVGQSIDRLGQHIHAENKGVHEQQNLASVRLPFCDISTQYFKTVQNICVLTLCKGAAVHLQLRIDALPDIRQRNIFHRQSAILDDISEF